MIEQWARLAERIRDEVAELDRVVSRAQEGCRRAAQSADDYYLDGVALNLHGFYGGLERLFQRIAAVIDGDVPQGANWHQVLLDQMTAQVPKVRPAVISVATRDALDEYRGFRHIVRNVYTFKFDPAKVQVLAERAPAVLAQVQLELASFADLVEQQAQDDE